MELRGVLDIVVQGGGSTVCVEGSGPALQLRAAAARDLVLAGG